MLVKKKMWINLAGGFASVLTLMVVVAYVGYNGMSTVIATYNQGNQINRLFNIISTARQQEKNFIIHQDKHYAEFLEKRIAAFIKEAEKAKNGLRGSESVKHLDAILSSTDTYNKAFKDYVTHQAQLTDAQAAMERNAQALIETSQTLEETFESELATARTNSHAKVLDKLSRVEDANQIIEWALECQLNEKQYIVSKKDQHVQIIDTHIKDIIELARKMKRRFTHKGDKRLATSLIESAEIYHAGFKQYVMLPWKGSELDMLEGAKDLIATSRSIRTKHEMELRWVQLDANAYMENHLARAQNMHQVVNAILFCLRDGRKFFMLGSDAYVISVNVHINNIIRLSQKISQQIKDAQNREGVRQILELISVYKDAFNRSVELKRRQKEDVEVFMAAARATDDAFEQIHADQIILIERQTAFARNLLLAGSALGVLFGAVLAFFVIRQATKTNNLLRNAKEQAEMASQAKSDFLALMSHEIRTPLNAVTGLTHIVLKSKLSGEQRDYLNKVQIASNNLLGVINDILDFSKVEAGRLELTCAPFNLDQILEKLSDLFSNRVCEKDLEMVFAVASQVPRQLMGDAGRLTQVLTNLIENAVKFTENGEVDVRVEPAEMALPRKGQIALKFIVRDTGIGIAADVLPTLFDPFTQAEDYLTREHEGTGLGLAICQRLVELMGGTISAESAPDQGSTFSFTAVLEAQQEQKSRLQPPPNLHGLKTLVVDDSETARQMLVKLLEAYTFNVSAVDSGQKAIEALEQAAAMPYQLVLLDWKMPGLDGIETARRIREIKFKGQNLEHNSKKPNTKKPQTPIIIMVTCHGLEMVQARLDTSAVDTYLIKPVKPSQLFNAIMKLFNQRKSMVLPHKQKPAVHPLEQLTGRRVLVVEDSELNRDVAVALLMAAGIEVYTAGNGRNAVDKVTQSPKHDYDAVLMDIQMPVMDGYQATERIRTWEKNTGLVDRRIPIIALTAHALKGEKEKCMAAGMDDYIAKPIDENQLYQVLLNWISHPKKEAHAAVRIPAEETSDTQAVLDYKGALKRMGGRKQIYMKALKKFGPEFSQTHGAIARHLAAGDKATASRLAHSVKGTAITIGAVRLSQVADRLESDINNTCSDVDSLIGVFKNELETAMEAIDRFLDAK